MTMRTRARTPLRIAPSPPRGEDVRRAFTLVELLVVISLVVLMSALAVLVIPGAMDSQRSSEGGARLQGWLMQAQQRAALDRSIRGLRLLPDPNNGDFYTQAQFLERPDDFTGGTVLTHTNKGTQILTQVDFTGVDLSGGNSTDPTQSAWPVQVGDYLEVQGSGLMHRITTVTTNTVTLTATAPLPQAITTATANYRIQRAPRVLGDEPELMPSSIGVDPSTNNINYGGGQPPPFATITGGTASPVDILFSPKGELIGTTSSNPVVLWVRDITLGTATGPGGPEFEGSPSLIVIFPRSGRIAAFDVNTDATVTGSNGLGFPYAFVQ